MIFIFVYFILVANCITSRLQYKHYITCYKTVSIDDFECIIRLAIFEKEDALQWVTSFEQMSLNSWRSYKAYPEETNRIVFKVCTKSLVFIFCSPCCSFCEAKLSLL